MNRWAWLFAMFSLSSAAFGQATMGFKLVANDANPLKYWVDNRTPNPSGLTLTQVTNASKNAFQTWQDLSCASTAFAYQGDASGNVSDPEDPYDNFSVTANWITSKSNPFYDSALGGGVATAAALILSFDGIAYNCDVYVNGVDYNWSASLPTPSNSYDLQSVLLHEHGHCQGLGHTNISADVMFTRARIGGPKRTPTANDTNTICGLRRKLWHRGRSLWTGGRPTPLFGQQLRLRDGSEHRWQQLRVLQPRL
jgi:hypothetical protein